MEVSIHNCQKFSLQWARYAAKAWLTGHPFALDADFAIPEQACLSFMISHDDGIVTWNEVKPYLVIAHWIFHEALTKPGSSILLILPTMLQHVLHILNKGPGAGTKFHAKFMAANYNEVWHSSKPTRHAGFAKQLLIYLRTRVAAPTETFSPPKSLLRFSEKDVLRRKLSSKRLFWTSIMPPTTSRRMMWN